MGFLIKLRLRAGLFFLRKHSQKIERTRKVLDFSKVNSIVLLFEANEPKMPPAVEQLTQALIKENKKVFQVIFFTGDLNRLEYGPHERRIFITAKDLNLFYKPESQTIESFNKINAEYLVDLNLNDCFPLVYLAGISSNYLRIGKHSEMRLPYFDVLINEQSEDQREFVQHLLHYVRILNPNQHEYSF